MNTTKQQKTRRPDLLSVRDLERNEVLQLFEIAALKDRLFKVHHQALTGRILGYLFFQPSTRTQFSFQSAFLRLGGSCIGFSDLETTRLGGVTQESCADTARIISKYCDLLVTRTRFERDLFQMAEHSTVPVISAGGGEEEHPTQALTDVFTIMDIRGSLEDLTILMTGNLNYRTIHSLLLLLSRWPNTVVHLLSPKELALSHSWCERLSGVFKEFRVFDSYDDYLETGLSAKVDVLYQEEFRTPNVPTDQANQQHASFKLSVKKLTHFSQDLIALHPLPRSSVIPVEVDDKPQARYFEQATNGLYVRAALFLRTLDQMI